MEQHSARDEFNWVKCDDYSVIGGVRILMPLMIINYKSSNVLELSIQQYVKSLEWPRRISPSMEFDLMQAYLNDINIDTHAHTCIYKSQGRIKEKLNF